MYGLADSAKQYYPEQYTRTTASTSTFDEQRFQQYKEEVDAKMKAEIQQYQEKIEEEMRRRDEEMKRRDEEMLKRQEMISHQFSQLMASAPWSQWGPPPPSGSHQVGPSWGPSSAAPGSHQTSSSSAVGSQSGIPAQGWWSGPTQGWWGPPQTAPHAPPSTSHAQVPAKGNLQQARDRDTDKSDSSESD